MPCSSTHAQSPMICLRSLADAHVSHTCSGTLGFFPPFSIPRHVVSLGRCYVSSQTSSRHGGLFPEGSIFYNIQKPYASTSDQDTNTAFSKALYISNLEAEFIRFCSWSQKSVYYITFLTFVVILQHSAYHFITPPHTADYGRHYGLSNG